MRRRVGPLYWIPARMIGAVLHMRDLFHPNTHRSWPTALLGITVEAEQGPPRRARDQPTGKRPATKAPARGAGSRVAWK